MMWLKEEEFTLEGVPFKCSIEDGARLRKLAYDNPVEAVNLALELAREYGKEN